MDRLACVDVPALPLQLFCRRMDTPAGERLPMAVVDRDKPQGLVEWVNEAARAQGVLPGMRYSAALAACMHLRAGVVAPAEVETCVAALAEELRHFTPEVEPHAGEPGVFWLDAGGLARLIESHATWGADIRRALAQAGFRAVVAVGWSRFGTYALAKAGGRRTVIESESPEAEARAARAIPLARIGLAPVARERLAQLAVYTVGDFLALPAGGVLTRFGKDVHRLHQLAEGTRWAPLVPRAPDEAFSQALDLDDPDADAASLAFLVKQLVDPLLTRLGARDEAVRELTLALRLADKSERTERIRPAEPTRESTPLLALVRLRLESLALAAGVTRLEVTVEGVRARHDQLALLEKKPRRDLDAARRALARLRASFGDGAVVRAKLASGHLPEARFTWEPLDSLPPAKPREVAPRPLMRRIEARPRALEHGPVVASLGPYRLSGGWWQGEVDREYYFTEMRSGETLWIYYDRKRRRWFLHGEVS